MYLSATLTSLPGNFASAIRQVAALGFEHADVVALAERAEDDLEVLADSGLMVSCGILGRGLPQELTLDAPSVERRRATLNELKKQLADAARLGATHCYLVPGVDNSRGGLMRFCEGCCLLADFAAQRMVRLCIEHFPGRSLPSAAASLAWLAETGHQNLALLLDVGHCLISREDPASIIRQAGPALGYVHLDDNDGINDLHLPLAAGQINPIILRQILTALRESGYAGALALEYNPNHPKPVEALCQGKALLEMLLASDSS